MTQTRSKSPHAGRFRPTRGALLLVASAALLLGSGCSLMTGYSGDGRFVDHGYFAMPVRYVLDLGPIDLSSQGRYARRLARLPAERMTIGLDIVEEGSDTRHTARHSARIRLQLKTTDGQLVMDENGTLDSWSWGRSRVDSSTFYAVSGQMRYVPIEGVSRPERLGEKADRGWGSSFLPGSGAVYQLEFEVLSPDSTPSGPVHLMLEGGGFTYP